MATWRVEDPEPTAAPVGVPAQTLVSLHYVRTAVHRRLKELIALAVAGMLAGIALVLLLPMARVGTVTLYLAHDTGIDPGTAMATDVSLLRTRTVAEEVIGELNLALSPEDLQKSILVSPATSSILEIEVAAPTSTTATRRAEVVADRFLEFRAEQLRKQSDAFIEGQKTRIDKLSAQADRLSQQYDALLGSPDATQGAASTLLTQRARIVDQISGLQADIDQRSLSTDSVITASHVVDPAAVVPVSTHRRAALAGVSGMIGGTAVGLAWVLVTTIASGRLRRRDEVSRSLGVPVRFSVQRRRPFPWVTSRATPAPAVLAAAVEAELAREDDAADRDVAFVAVGARTEAADIAHEFAGQMHRAGRSTCVLHLGGTGRRSRLRRKAAPPAGSTVIEVDVASAEPVPLRLTAGTDDAQDPVPMEAWRSADCLVVVDEVDLGLGVAHLTRWVDRAVLVVGAGRATAEVLETVARLFRTAQLPLAFAIVVGADAADGSCGVADDPPVGGASA